MNMCSETNVESTPCKCCMHSSDMGKLPTDVIMMCAYYVRENIDNCQNNVGSTLLLN